MLFLTHLTIPFMNKSTKNESNKPSEYLIFLMVIKTIIIYHRGRKAFKERNKLST